MFAILLFVEGAYVPTHIRLDTTAENPDEAVLSFIRPDQRIHDVEELVPDESLLSHFEEEAAESCWLYCLEGTETVLYVLKNPSLTRKKIL